MFESTKNKKLSYLNKLRRIHSDYKNGNISRATKRYNAIDKTLLFEYALTDNEIAMLILKINESVNSG